MIALVTPGLLELDDGELQPTIVARRANASRRTCLIAASVARLCGLSRTDARVDPEGGPREDSLQTCGHERFHVDRRYQGANVPGDEGPGHRRKGNFARGGRRDH